jgi:FtsP/CotA-like multicopper oxidase with cupredoxin domain
MARRPRPRCRCTARPSCRAWSERWTGTNLVPSEHTDTVAQMQAQRGILEFRYGFPGRYMFHAHKTEFAELGWTGVFQVED